MRWRLGVVALALAMAAVACGGGGASVATTAPSAAPAQTESSAEPVAEGSYESLRAMQLDVEAAFYLCTAPIKVYDPPVVERALEQADCSNAVGLLMFEPTDVAASAADLQASAEGPLTLMVGTNWIITCASDAAPCERIHAETGGELIPSP